MASDDHAEKRVIKRYSNRKLYDTKDSRYVTLQQIGEMVRQGEDVQIIDNKTKEDKTEVTLALILSEDLKNKPRSVPLGTLRTLIQERGDRILSTLRDGPLGRLISRGDDHEQTEEEEPAPEAPPAAPSRGRVKETLDQLQQRLDEQVSAVVPGLRDIRELREELETLRKRVEALEAAEKDRRS